MSLWTSIVDTDSKELSPSVIKYRQFICGEDAIKISPSEPYCLHRPIRRGHLNISQHYSTFDNRGTLLYFEVLSGTFQVLENLHAIWDWILIETLHIPHSERNLYSAILVVSETCDNRGTS